MLNERNQYGALIYQITTKSQLNFQDVRFLPLKIPCLSIEAFRMVKGLNVRMLLGVRNHNYEKGCIPVAGGR